MKQIIFAIAAVAIIGSASPQRRPLAPVSVDQIRANCPLTVSFGSYAMGVDRGAYDAVLKLLAGDGGVTRIEKQVWGREGEKTLCAVTRNPADARRLFDRIKPLFPRKPRGPLTVTLQGGRSYHATESGGKRR